MLAKFHGRRKTRTGAPTVATTTKISKNDRWIFDNGRRHIQSGFAEKSEKEIAKMSPSQLSEALASIGQHVVAVKEITEAEHRKYSRASEQHHAFLLSEWLNMEHDLVRERGLWGDEDDAAVKGNSSLMKLKLDPHQFRQQRVVNKG